MKDRILKFLFGAVFAVMALLLFRENVLPELEKRIRYAGWRETPCSVESSAIEPRHDNGLNYSVRVAYRYTLEGREWHGEWREGGERNRNRMSEEAAREIAALYPESRASVCRVNPANPAESALRVGLGGRTVFEGCVAVVFFLVGGALALRGLGVVPSISGASEGTQRRVGRVLGFFMGLAFTLIGFSGLWWLGVKPALLRHEAHSWVETPCVIEEVGTRSVRAGRHGSKTLMEARFSYDFGGVRHESFRLSLDPGSGVEPHESLCGRTAEECLARGARLSCFVNPANPSESVLSRELPAMYPVGVVFFGLFAGLGPALLVFSFANADSPAARRVGRALKLFLFGGFSLLMLLEGVALREVGTLAALPFLVAALMFGGAAIYSWRKGRDDLAAPDAGGALRREAKARRKAKALRKAGRRV